MTSSCPCRTQAPSYASPVNEPGEMSLTDISMKGFHNDQGDIVSLYCRTAAKQGGELCLSSGWTIYNELTAKHPDVVKTLTQPWQWQNRR